MQIETKVNDIQPIGISISNDDLVDALRYCYNDYSLTTQLYKQVPKMDISSIITRVVFNNPATIVFWNDGTKTVVKKSEDDIWDPEKGLCMAIIKKINGKTNFIRKVVEENLEPEHFLSVEEAVACLSNFGNNLKGGE